MQLDEKLLKQCWFLAGPTAVGKTATALQLAILLDAEILSLDSMAIYKSMDIGTAKPTRQEQAQIPHHLIDLIEPHEEYSLTEYVAAAETAAAEITTRGKKVLFVGGTGLYLRGVLRGVFDGPPADWEFRQTLEREAALQSEDYLHNRLAAVDLVSARRLHPRDHRRLIRALEVHHLTGQPLSDQQRQGPLPKEQRPPHVFWLHPPREWLYNRIDRRVMMMLKQGWQEEVEAILQHPEPLGRTARQALGYKEIIDCLQGEISQDQMVGLIQSRTRQFAKRQHTWFRNLEECREVPIHGSESPEELATTIIHIAETTTGDV